MAPQLMAGEMEGEVTVPTPVPLFTTFKSYETLDVVLKLAVTDFAEFIVTKQLEVPVQAPDHPVKFTPAGGLETERVTAVPLAKLAEQLEPQLMPAGAELTAPRLAAVPPFETVKV